MINSSSLAFVFGPFRLLPLERRLLEGERPLRLGGRAMDLLLALLERAEDAPGVAAGDAEYGVDARLLENGGNEFRAGPAVVKTALDAHG